MGLLDPAASPVYCGILQHLPVSEVVIFGSIEMLMIHFNLGNDFLDILHRTSAVISGSSALAVINPWIYDPVDLDVYVNSYMADVLVNLLKEEYNMVQVEPPTPQQYDEPPGNIFAIYTLRHGPFKVDVVESRSSAMSPIFTFHSTAVMNCISSRSIFCAFPHLTSSFRNLGSWAFDPMISQTIAYRQLKLDKYTDRGYEGRWELHEWEDMQDKRPLTQAYHQFTWRTANDKYCLWFDYEPGPSDESPYRGPPHPWMLTF
ncbi:hypothetical protein H0H93_006576 [Arthromyces matolae]|nr:hypothetical protein H0H93_006576 [Arthromyces matolae]